MPLLPVWCITPYSVQEGKECAATRGPHALFCVDKVTKDQSREEAASWHVAHCALCTKHVRASCPVLQGRGTISVHSLCLLKSCTGGWLCQQKACLRKRVNVGATNSK